MVRPKDKYVGCCSCGGGGGGIPYPGALPLAGRGRRIKSFFMSREFDYAKGNSIIRGKFDYEKGVLTQRNKFSYKKEIRLWKKKFYSKKK